MPAANDLPYFPFHVDDYLNDPAVLAMDADAEGCYLRLLFRSWRSPTPGRICDRLIYMLADGWRLEAQYRAALSDGSDAAGHERWGHVVDQIEAAFDTKSTPGFWIQKRMMIEYLRAVGMVNARRRGGVNRWKVNALQADLKDTSRTPRGIVDLDLDLEKNPPPHPTPQPPRSATASRKGKFDAIDRLPLPAWLTAGAWDDWCEFRRAKPSGALWSHKAASLSISCLAKLRDKGHDPQRVIDQSILNGWRGLFPLKAPDPDPASEPVSEWDTPAPGFTWKDKP